MFVIHLEIGLETSLRFQKEASVIERKKKKVQLLWSFTINIEAYRNHNRI